MYASPQRITFTNDVDKALIGALSRVSHSNVIVIADENTARLVVPLLSESTRNAQLITISAGDENKTLDTAIDVWQAMETVGATRHSLAINVGGGVVTDLGGFAAATFKRGIDFINVPTTLLSAIDAAVGGKTGVNFNGLKNEIGTFANAQEVIISTRFFSTLPLSEVKSGYAEMLKHALLQSEQSIDRLLDCDFNDLDLDSMLSDVEESVSIKAEIVRQDPTEQGLRRALNLGHTVGHALESRALHKGNPVPHGYAVAWGLVAETVLSHMRLKFPAATLHRLAQFVRENYAHKGLYFTCDDYDELLSLMRHDKKSRQGEINCTLLKHSGAIVIDNEINDDDMRNALDITRDLMGI